jgi:ATP-dependent protease ClpP protease subunit
MTCQQKSSQRRWWDPFEPLVWIVAIQCMLTVAAQADLRILERRELFISGTITEADAKAFAALSPELERFTPLVKLDSNGGDVDAAMNIGRLLRKYEGSTWIAKEESAGFNANCYSSCALIFIAGVHRAIVSDGGQLGLHRPYLASAPQSRQAVEKQAQLMLSQVRQYIAEMGMTTHEMRKREAGTEACSKRTAGTDWHPCGEAIRWGLTERVYLERDKQAQTVCQPDGGFEFLLKIPAKGRRDHPVWIKRETCIRNIMLGHS